MKMDPIISIITPYYNAEDYIEETAKCVLEQTFPLFEWIIINDGSSEKSTKKIKEIEKKDKRIKIITLKKNGVEGQRGPAVSRDIGVQNSQKSSKYIVFLDSDDLLDKTYLECCYWTLETHPEASWAYTDTVNFGAKNFLWRKWYSVEWEKYENLLLVSACVRKKDFLEVGGFGIQDKNVYEDWYLWLKMIKAGKFPVRINALLTYYRQKENGSVLKISNTENRQEAMKLIKTVRDEIFDYRDGIQFPKYDYNWEKIKDENEDIIELKRKKDDKIYILMIIPWMVVGGADKFNLDLITKLDKRKFEFIIITTLPSTNEWRIKFEKNAIVYDLTTFLEMKDWICFINYIIKKYNIDLIFNSNSQFGYKILPYLKAKNPTIPILDYVHIEEWYWRNGGFARDSSVISNVIDKTLTCNENSKKILVKYFGRLAREIKTIYIGVDEKYFTKEKTKNGLIRKEDNVFITDSNKYHIGFICRIVEQKRPYLFFEVCKKLWEFRKDFDVIVAGDGAMLNGLKEKVKQNNMEEVFTFVGNIEDTRKIYEICDITLNTSIKDGIALTTYESLAMGVPVISSNVGGQGEVISEDVGVIVPCMQDETEIANFNYSDREIQNYVNAINKVLSRLNIYKANCRKRILDGFTINKMLKNMDRELSETAYNPNEEKIVNGKLLSENTDVLKELITTYLVSIKDEYIWLSDEFNRKNIHQEDRFEKRAKKMLYYEHTLEYKIKHPIVVLLKKIGAYNRFKKIFAKMGAVEMS